MGEWQPIETAPRDFTPIIVFVRASRIPYQEEPDEIHIVYWKRDGWVYQADDNMGPMTKRVTHWMPLPAAPQRDMQEVGG